MKKLRLIFDRIMAVLLSVSVLSMVIVALLGIFTRVVVGRQASFTVEYLRYALLWVSLFAGAYCFGQNGHIAITFLKDKFKGKSLLVLNVFTQFTIIFFAVAILIYGGYKGVIMGMNEISPTLHVKVGYIYLALPVSGIFIIFYSIVNLLAIFRGEAMKINEQNT